MKRFQFLGVLTVAAVLFAWGFVQAAVVPEFDAVGCDSTNYFVDPVMREVISKNTDSTGKIINSYSSFAEESFTTSAGILTLDPCFTYNGTYYSALTDAYNSSWYEWNIVLQMKPSSDINLEIRDCVLKANTTDIWTGAWQTGLFQPASGDLYFIPSANPTLTVQAFPGPYAADGFVEEFFLEARVGPSLQREVLDEFYYSSKSLWTENILIALPETGQLNGYKQLTYTLREGDIIRIRIEVPLPNTADVRYGKDNVILKYNGIFGTWYLGSNCAPRLGPIVIKPIIEKPIRIPPAPPS